MLALGVGWLALLGQKRLMLLSSAVIRGLEWPRPASPLSFILALAVTTAALATIPHYFWICIRPRARLSVIGVLLLTLIVAELGLHLLMLSPLVMPR